MSAVLANQPMVKRWNVNDPYCCGQSATIAKCLKKPSQQLKGKTSVEKKSFTFGHLGNFFFPDVKTMLVMRKITKKHLNIMTILGRITW